MNRIPDRPLVAERAETTEKLPPLINGDRLDQKTVHARYEAMPSHVRAELIGGIVYRPSPLKPPHGRTGPQTLGWLILYEAATPGVETYENTTSILDEQSEPQPDAFLIVSPALSGQMRLNEDGYLEGAPEFVAEIAYGSESIDLHGKKDDYERTGVKEYLVVALRQQRVHWFILRDGRYHNHPPGADGIYRSEVFPGLWLDPAALLRLDALRIKQVLDQGLATP